MGKSLSPIVLERSGGAAPLFQEVRPREHPSWGALMLISPNRGRCRTLQPFPEQVGDGMEGISGKLVGSGFYL